ncbi:hypothetical protein OG705_19565 [Streptomyces sp. NBC_00838]|uniref:hypothetical protein n=1 Tax=Streptomyces sp. NBC_00838 TaxID=2903680 RepID=UPI003869551B|nr:hypothetical protein OG705_19565 [Streptomyces sp. NBC_00838]
MRLRIRFDHDRRWPRRAIVLTDTPRPDCGICDGHGFTDSHYGDETGEYAGTDYDPCPCWNPSHIWPLLPLPRTRPDKRAPDPWASNGYSDEPPF